jgi:hypothetical protein
VGRAWGVVLVTLRSIWSANGEEPWKERQESWKERQESWKERQEHGKQTQEHGKETQEQEKSPAIVDLH